MSDPRTTVQEVQGQIVDTIAKSQAAVVDAVKAWADAVKSVTAEVPGVPQVTEKLPDPAVYVADAYDFAERLLATQREFSEKVLEATAPVFAKRGETA
jgi:hypothetical protein